MMQSIPLESAISGLYIRHMENHKSISAARKHIYLSSVIARVAKIQHDVDETSVAKALGYKSVSFVEGWFKGETLPPLAVLPALALAVRVPTEDVLLPWLIDSNPENRVFYEILCIHMVGPELAKDLLSGEMKNSHTPWFKIPAKPYAPAVWVDNMKDAPDGWFRDFDHVHRADNRYARIGTQAPPPSP